MKKVLSVLTLFFILASGCKKDVGVPDREFVAGDLVIGIKPEAELKKVFDTLNMESLKISTMFGFVFTVDLPQDSLTSLLKFLDTKPYIKTGTGWRASAYYYQPERVIRVCSSFFNMSPAYQSDLLNTISLLNLKDTHQDIKDIILKVPNGTEKYWLNTLKKYSFVKWAELNYIEHAI